MPAAVPREAATVVVARPANSGLEVLLLQRAERGDHNSGAWVFPGGLVDPGDRERGDGLAFHRAAVRECREECGIQLDTGGLHLIAHWLTPMGRAKRFDTRFFVAVVTRGHSALHDGNETTDHVWITPAEALSPRNSRRLMTPTRSTLEMLLPFDSVAALEAWAAQPRQVQRILPRLAIDANGTRPVQPHEPGYDEVAKLDPQGRCDIWCELRPGVEVRIGERVTRIVGPDGSNRYFVDGLAVQRPTVVEGIAIGYDTAPAGAQWLAPSRGFLLRV